MGGCSTLRVLLATPLHLVVTVLCAGDIDGGVWPRTSAIWAAVLSLKKELEMVSGCVMVRIM